MTRPDAVLHLALLAALGAVACAPADGAPPPVTVHAAAGVLAGPDVVDAAPASPGGPTAEPLILGPPVVTATGVSRPTAVAVGDDGHYYVRSAGGGRVVRVDAETGAVTGAAARAAGDGAPAVDAHGRVYSVDPAAGTVRVVDPAEWGGGPRPILTRLDAPAGLAVDTVRGRLLVAERGAGRLQVYELP